MTFTHNDTFRAILPFNLRMGELLTATAAALTVFFLALFVAGLGPSGTGTVEAGVLKGDRMALAQEDACAGQTWGDWNKACLDALADQHDIDLAPSRTVEFRDAERRLSVLMREPHKS